MDQIKITFLGDVMCQGPFLKAFCSEDGYDFGPVFAQMKEVFSESDLVVGNLETYVSGVAPAVRETALGLGLGAGQTLLLLANECVYPIFSTYLLAFARAIAEVGAVSMVGGAIAWKTNVMTTAIMQYTNQGNFSLGIALGIILMTVSLLVNIAVSLLQRRLSR